MFLPSSHVLPEYEVPVQLQVKPIHSSVHEPPFLQGFSEQWFIHCKDGAFELNSPDKQEQ